MNGCKSAFDFADPGDLVALGIGLGLGLLAIGVALLLGRWVDR